jgi:hypothetical protein
MHLASRCSTRAKSKPGKGATSVVPQEAEEKNPASAAEVAHFRHTFADIRHTSDQPECI